MYVYISIYLQFPLYSKDVKFEGMFCKQQNVLIICYHLFLITPVI